MIFGPITPRRQGTAACCMHVLGPWRPIPIPCLAMHAAALPSHADARGARQASRSEALGASQTHDRQISLRLHASTGRKGGHRMRFASGLHRILFPMMMRIKIGAIAGRFPLGIIYSGTRACLFTRSLYNPVYVCIARS